MNKGIRLIKGKIATILIVALCINSFAAIVGDNDGAAFITKAEFDSLKNEFQSQIDRYNASIDNKIDGMIAAYLSGIKIAAKKTIKPYVENYDEIRWMHGPYMYFTSRKFPNVTTSAFGTYVDNTSFKFIEMENRRQSGGDQFFWFFDVVASRTGSHHLTMRLNRLGYCPKEWGAGNDSIQVVDGGGWSAEGTPNRRPPTIFLQCKKDDGKWVIEKDAKPIAAEIGLLDEIHILPHHGTKYGDWPENPTGLVSIYGIDPRHLTLSGRLIDDIYAFQLLNLSSGSDEELLYYCIPNLQRVVNQTTRTSQDIAFASRITLANNPQAYQSCVTQDLFITNKDGDTRYPLKTGTGLYVDKGAATARQRNYQTAADANVTDVRWQTEKQFDYDNNNLIYGMWGTDVSGDINVAPYPITQNDMTYIPLQESPYQFTLDVEPIGVNMNTINPHSAHKAYDEQEQTSFTHWIRGVDNDWTTGVINYENLSLTIPLFYRSTWSNLYSRAFINTDTRAPLGKSDGLPIIIDSSDFGTLTITYKYEEKVDLDTSLVTLTPDQKIKTYFKDKKFTDTGGKFLSGRTSTASEASVVSLNGTEWTEKKVTVVIDINKGDSVWMRIDPLTENSIYCKMSDFKCELVTES